MKTYLTVFLEEKGISDHIFEFPSNGAYHIIEMPMLVEFISNLPEDVQEQIKTIIVKIDFMNENVLDFFEYVAKGMIQLG